MRHGTTAILIWGLVFLTGAQAKEHGSALILKKGQRVAVVGDSITEQKLYSRFIEMYLTVCLSELDLKVVQLGWGGETAGGFAGRMNNDLLPWHPDVVTTCYGMNDGGYRKYEDGIGKRYHDSMADIVERLKKAGATVVVGSPGVVDSTYFKNPNTPAAVYNDNLAHLRDVARALAESEGQLFADVHAAMMTAMEKAKPALGEAYDVGGKDGVHPGPNGHLLMAYAFLKAMGIDGQIGTITVDLKGTASATEGHRVLSSEAGKAEIESARWPFCFSGDEKSSGGTRSILPFTAFNQDLNRLTLVVKNLEAPKAKVVWGTVAKSFTKAELEKGVNLAAEFAENPFSESFRKVEGLVASKQQYETVMIKQTINSFPRLVEASGKDAEVTASVDTLRRQLFNVHERMSANIRTAVVPVKHAIAVTPEN
jgi:lysophospholipase L1-like esterase